MINGELMSANLKTEFGFHFAQPYAGQSNKIAFNQKTLIPQSIKNTKAKYSTLNLGDLKHVSKKVVPGKVSLRPKENGGVKLEKNVNL